MYVRIRTDSNGVVYCINNRGQDSCSFSVHTRQRLTKEDRAALIEAVPGLEYATGRDVGYGTDIMYARAFTLTEIIEGISKFFQDTLAK